MATTVNTLETYAEVFKGDRVVADGVERSLGDVTDLSTLVPDGSLNTSTTDNIPAMTSNTAPSGYVASASSIANSSWEPYQAFKNDGYAFGWLNLSGSALPAWIQIQIPAAKIFNKMTMHPTGTLDRAATAFRVDASNTGSFTGEEVTLDTFSGFSAWVANTPKTFTWSNSTAYSYYRVVCTVSNGSALHIGTAELEFIEAVDSLKYTADFNTPLASIPTSVYRLDHDNLTVSGTPTATTATVLDSRTGLIASGDTVLLDGVGVVCTPVVETDVSDLEPDGSLNVSTTDATPLHSGYTSGSNSISATSELSATYAAWKAVDDGGGTWIAALAVTTADLIYIFGTAIVIK